MEHQEMIDELPQYDHPVGKCAAFYHLSIVIQFLIISSVFSPEHHAFPVLSKVLAALGQRALPWRRQSPLHLRLGSRAPRRHRGGRSGTRDEAQRQALWSNAFLWQHNVHISTYDKYFCVLG